VTYFPTFLARYSVFVQTVPLNPKKTNNILKGTWLGSRVTPYKNWDHHIFGMAKARYFKFGVHLQYTWY